MRPPSSPATRGSWTAASPLDAAAPDRRPVGPANRRQGGRSVEAQDRRSGRAAAPGTAVLLTASSRPSPRRCPGRRGQANPGRPVAARRLRCGDDALEHDWRPAIPLVLLTEQGWGRRTSGGGVDWDWEDGPSRDEPARRRPPEEPPREPPPETSPSEPPPEESPREFPLATPPGELPLAEPREFPLDAPPGESPPAGPPREPGPGDWPTVGPERPVLPTLESARRAAAGPERRSGGGARTWRVSHERAAARERRRRQVRRRRLVALAVIIVAVLLLAVLVVRGCGDSAKPASAYRAPAASALHLQAVASDGAAAADSTPATTVSTAARVDRSLPPSEG